MCKLRVAVVMPVSFFGEVFDLSFNFLRRSVVRLKKPSAWLKYIYEYIYIYYILFFISHVIYI